MSERKEPRRPADGSVVFSARRIAELMPDENGRVLWPTAEQQRVIEHPLGGSALVVAGAGSGKTETMANRVVWLVANGLVQPDQVLGLTFTRKAAGELGERVLRRLDACTAALVDANERGLLSARESARTAELIAASEDGLMQPDISTYNSFASSIVQEFGAAAGVLSSATVIDAATAWRIARETILASSAPELVTSDTSISTLVKRVLELEHAVNDNLTTLDRVDQVIAELGRVLELPHTAKRAVRAQGDYASVRDAVASHRETPLLTRLAREFAEEKRRRGVLEFSDQLVLAVQTVERSRDARRVLRERSPVVLLDEVQDTSVGQTRLLSELFAGNSVMAVGDPHQSIYGWRGASADNLRSFAADFRGTGGEAGGGSAAELTLSTSWRNPSGVLDAANALAEPLHEASSVRVEALSPAPQANAGDIEWVFSETIDEEYARLAEWMRDARAEAVRLAELAARAEGVADAERRVAPPTAAVLFRGRAAMPAVAEALTAAGVPNRIVGLGGLLATPEVTDVVCALRCVWYADAGSELIRLLAGPRFRIGTADIDGLGSAAKWFERRDVSQRRLSEEDRAASVIPDFDRQFTLLDVLDEIAGMKDLDHVVLGAITEVGRRRLREAGQMLRRLRQSVGAGIPDLLRGIEQELRLDIELDAHERSGHEGSAVARANLDAFAELVEGFIAVDGRGTLPSVLAWLERASEDDEAAEHVPEPEPGTVDLITVHGSKGLEWELVAIPRLVAGEFPGSSREGAGWLRPGQLPDELRGDAGARPTLDWRTATTQEELHNAIRGYNAERGKPDSYVPGYRDLLRERQALEERRLAYVAVTRTSGRLFLSGSFWGGQSRPRSPSVFLEDLQEAGIIAGLPEQSAHETDPSRRAERTAIWPLDPLGARRQPVAAAAAAVRAGLDAPAEEPGIDPTVELLLIERAEHAAGRPGGPSAGDPGGSGADGSDTDSARRTEDDGLPDRVTASTFHEFVEDPERAERMRLRPLPARPYRRTRIGNRFHEWVERRATTALGTALPLHGLEPEEAAPREDDPGAEFGDETELAPLIEQFERSRFADRQPIAVEQEVALPFAGRSLVCKLDAVYRVGEGDETRYEVVDWKSGKPPANEAERQSRFFQLDLYRHAYAQWAGVAPERIDVSLFYVAEGEELRGEHPRSLEELEEIWLAAAARLTG